MSDNRCLSEQEVRLCKENNIGTEHVVVTHRSEKCIVLLNNRTRDNIVITKGDRKWL